MTDAPPLNHRPEVKDLLDDLLPAAFPGVKVSRAFGYPAYKVDGRIFAFVGGEGIALKLGEAATRRLNEPGTPYTQFVLENGAVWKAWLNIDHADPASYEDDLQLFADSIALVRGLG
jgi:hypothetical protein